MSPSLKIRQTDDCVYAEPDAAPSAAVIWLHGLGADGFDFVPVAEALALPTPPRYLFPNAPLRPITLNGGMPMRGWYDILSLDRNGLQDETGVRASAARVDGLIQAQIEAGIAAERIILAGFSQGGAIALHTALRHPLRLGGLLALSTYLPLAGQLASEASATNRDLPILMCHGTRDPVLPAKLGEDSRDALRAMGYSVQWQDYPMEHQVCLEEIELIGSWLRLRLD